MRFDRPHRLYSLLMIVLLCSASHQAAAVDPQTPPESGPASDAASTKTPDSGTEIPVAEDKVGSPDSTTKTDVPVPVDRPGTPLVAVPGDSKPADPFGAALVRRFSFEREPPVNEDADYDLYPDGWMRRRGAGFPHYVQVDIDPKTGVHGSSSLRFKLNGAQAAIYSPATPIDSAHFYSLKAKVRTIGLVNDVVMISLSLIDESRQRTRRWLSRPVSGSMNDWFELSLDDAIVPTPEEKYVVLGLHVVTGEKPDVRGVAWFDDLRLLSQPRIELRTKTGGWIFPPEAPIGVELSLQGLDRSIPHTVRMRFTNVEKQSLDEATFEIPAHSSPGADSQSLPVLGADAPPEAIKKGAGPDAAPGDESVEWIATGQSPGWYQFTAVIEQSGQPVFERSCSVVVAGQTEGPQTGEFGWSCETYPDFAAAAWDELTQAAGIRWIKLPLWSRSQVKSSAEGRRLAELVDHLESRGVSVVGLLTDPPQSLLDKFAQRTVLTSQVMLMPRSFWLPSLEATIAAYSFRVRHWQLGGDGDESFATMSSLPSTVAEVQQEFDRIGRDTRIGFAWNWGRRPPQDVDLSTWFLSLRSDHTMTARDLSEQIRAMPRDGATRWVVLQPSPPQSSSLSERAADLARRMISAKLAGAEVIFAADPLNPEFGLLNPDGSPRELFMPWRTVASALGGATYAGRLELDENSESAVFFQGESVCLVLWNDRDVNERLFLGGDVKVVDVWGRERTIVSDPKTGGVEIPVGPTPIFVFGASTAIVQWILSLRFENGKLKSETGEHSEALLVKNVFSQGASCKTTLHMPSDWKVEPNEWRFPLGAGESTRLGTLLSFPADASLGRFRVRVKFDVAADRTYRFEALLPYRLGYGDVEMLVSQRWIDSSRLEIEQTIINNTQPFEYFDFDCSLFVPGRIRQRQTVTRVGASRDRRFYVINAADTLVGKPIWLRAEQVNGRRILNLHFPVLSPSELPAARNAAEHNNR